MKRFNLLFAILTLLIFSACKSGNNRSGNAENQYQIIPKPVKLLAKKGQFTISPSTQVSLENDDAELRKAAEYFVDFIKQGSGLQLQTATAEAANDAIIFRLDDGISHPEGYQLSVSANKITISAKSGAGAFYGVQTLLQMMSPAIFKTENKAKTIAVSCAEITDEPRFSYRGMHLDVARHMFPVDFIKKYIDLLAMHKQNRFHWHLTEDQGWRIEIKAYPKLQEIAAFRDETVVGHASKKPVEFDGKRYGGFYTQEEVKEIVKYAQDRFITIIPEIEMPGHSSAVLAAYPELGCNEGPFKVQTTWGVFEEVYCPKEETFEFLENVLTEVIELFPGEYIHIGGDECPKAAWKASAFCQNLIKKEGLEDEHGLQSYFITRMEKFINTKGRKIIGWDEILEGGLAPNAAVMSWRGTEGGIEAARQKHPVVMTPTSHCYLDYYQSQSDEEPLAIGGFLPLEKVYSYDPLPEELSAEEAAFILGVQGNVWTEYISTPEQAEYMAFPRAIALAEVGWTPQQERSYKGFTTRLVNHFSRLDAMKVNYANHVLDVDGKVSGGENGLELALNAKAGDYEIRYMIIGGNDEKMVYRKPISITESTTIIAATHSGGQQIGNVAKFKIDLHKAAGAPIEISSPPHPSYNAGGKEALNNGILGNNTRYGDSEWLGWKGENFEGTIFLEDRPTINNISLRFFSSPSQWIYLPKNIEVSISDDGNIYSRVAQIATPAISHTPVKTVDIPLKSLSARFIKIKAHRFGIIPEGNQGAGHESWLFIDEIVVN